MDLSVIIPTRNASSTLGDQLDALAAQDFDGTWEVLVVNNASTDDTAAVVSRWQAKLPHLRTVDAPEVGLNRTRNIGVRASRADRILLCDADDEVSTGWVAAMASALDSADVVGGPLEYDALNPVSVLRPRPPDYATKEFPRLFGRPYAVGSNIGFSRRAFDVIGGFDESFSLGADEVDFSWRAQDAGLRFHFVRDGVVHYRLRSNLKALMRQQFGYARGHAHLYAKWVELGAVPRRPVSLQAKSAAARTRDLVVKFPKVRDRQERQLLALEAARLAGSFRAMLEWRAFV